MSTHWSAAKGPWRGEGIAIVGMAGRFPQAGSVDAFWRNLLDGRDCISRFTRQEMMADGVATQLLDNERFVPAGAVLDDVEMFDAQFFGISPREAESMDPQQRVFLEVVQHALDDAAIDPARAPGPIGVFAGARLSAYWLRLLKMPQFMAAVGWHQVAAGNDKDFLPSQASFRFDLRGPAVNVQAACSTSLLATAIGCDALIARRCDVAIAGGASISIPQRTGYVYAPSGIASADGLCRPFDAAASGSVLGNGVAVVVLKRLADALAAGDQIYAVIRGIGINNDGRTKSSFAGPSVQAQAEAISAAIAAAGVTPEQVGYVETHGTATSIGDPIEVAALGRSLGGRRRATPLGIGSLKSNVGHLDPASGVSSLIKAALILDRQVIPPSLHFETPNPAIDFAGAGVNVVAEKTVWPRGQKPRIAGVSAFGIGGTNVHAVLAEAPLMPVEAAANRPELIVLSAKTETALETMKQDLAAHLREQPETLASTACTLALGRGQHKFRCAFLAASTEVAIAELERPQAGPRFRKDRRIVFLYPGQGRQQLGMGKMLYEAEPAYREAFDAVADLASAPMGFDLRELIDPDRSAIRHDVTRTALAQPLLFATEVATARLWASWGIRPDDQLGHSIGELAAAHISGVFTLEDAVRVVVERGRLMQGMAPGAMLAVSLTEKEALGFEDDDICVAAFNGPREQTLAGSISGIDRLEGQLRERGVQFTRLDTSHAFHHPSMREAAAGLLQILREIPLSAPSRSFVSCVTGLPITAEEVMRAEYWADSIVQPVRFSRAARTLLDTPAAVYIECGAGRGLGAMVRTQGLGEDDIVLTSMAGRGEGLSDADCALEALGKAWQAGGAVDWQGVWRHRQRRCVHLPGYPFERQRHWIDDIADTQQQVIASPASVAAPGNCFVRGWAAADAPTAGAASGSQNWIVLCDESGLGSELCKRLRQDGASVVAVHSSGAAVHQSDIEYAVDPTQPAAMTDLVARLAPNCRPVHVVNAWAAIVRPGPLGPERAAHGAALTFHAPIRLLRALRAANFSVNRFTTVSGGLFAIGAGDRPEPIAAPALGLVRVMPQEIAGLSARLVDMAPPADGPAAQVLLDQLVSELNSAASEPVVAYRGDKRLIETFQPLHLPPPSLERLIRPGGVYMITGGFGGIGGVLARLIAQVEGVRLVLVGRRGLAEKDVETVRALEGLGATVLPLAADTANLNAMAQVFAEVQMRFGRISGIIHAAGVPGGRMLMLPEVGDAGNVFAPKLQGAVNLMSLVAPHQPDFIMLCSSFASVGGGMGQGEYAAANAFLDAIAAYGQFLGLRTTAISWPAWREVGMAHAIEMPPELDHLREASLRSGISPDEGAELFARIIASGAPHVVVAPYPDRQPPAAATRPSAVVELTTAVSTPVMPQIAADADDRTLLLARLGAIWSDVLGSASIAAEDNFFEIGGQSLMALSIVIRVGEEFGIELKLSDVLENPQLVQFADLVHQRLCDAIAAMPDEVVCEALAQEVLS